MTFSSIFDFQDGSRLPSWIRGAHLATFYDEYLEVDYDAKFGWNRSSGFDNMKYLIFYTFCLKKAIHAHFRVFKVKIRKLETLCVFIRLGIQ